MINDKKKSCVVCHAYLFEEDDVVYCPECGAPHHRECYINLGRCGLAEAHGTENQYDRLKREEPEEEPRVQEEQYDDQQTPPFTQSPFGQFTTFDFLGGVKPETVIEDGVTAKEAAKFVVSNTMRYIPKFVRGRKPSWNFLAFISPCGWFLSRKMYKNGIIAGVIDLIANLFVIPFSNVVYGGESVYLTPEAMADMFKTEEPYILLLGLIGSLLAIALRVLSGIFGDWIYRKHVISSVKDIKENSEDIETDYRKRGGVNIFLFLVGWMAVQYTAMYIVMFI